MCILTEILVPSRQVFLRKDGGDGGPGPGGLGLVLHRKRSSSIDLKLRLPSRRRTISSQASYTLGSPNPDATTPVKAFPMPMPGCGKALEGSVTLPIYVYDCPLTPSADLGAELPADIFEDRTFKWDWPAGGAAAASTTGASAASDGDGVETAASPSSPAPTSLDEVDSPDAATATTPRPAGTTDAAATGLQQLGRAISMAYSRCFVLALFEALHGSLRVHAVDVQAAVDECEEALVEVDITRFLHTVCGHLSGGGGPSHCHDLKLLHRLMKDKFRSILHASFRPVATHPEFHYCVPAGAGPGWDHKRLPGGLPGLPGLSIATPLHAGLSGLSGLSTLHVPNVPLHAMHDPLHVYAPQDLMQLTGSGWDGVLLATPDDAHTSLLSNMDSNSLSEVVDDGQLADEVSPLFLHLVCSVHAQGDMASYASRVLPTCVTELARGLEDSVTANCTGGGAAVPTSTLLGGQGFQVRA